MSELFQTIAVHAASRPDAVAIYGDRQVLDYASLHALIEAASQQLEGRVVGLLLDNGPDWIVLDIAAQVAGLCCVPLPTFFSDAQLQHVIKTAGIDLIITDQASRLDTLEGITETGTLMVTDTDLRVLHLSTDEQASVAGCAKISFTSGTSGQPKGVCLGQEQIMTVTRSLVQASAATEQDRMMSLLPLSTLLENIAVYAALLSGGNACLPSAASSGVGVAGLDVDKMCVCFSLFRPNLVVLVPQLLRALVISVSSGWKAPTSLRFIAVGGASVAPVVLRDAMNCGLPVYEGYGLSEAASVVALNRPGHFKTGSVGQVLSHAKVRIADDGEIEVGGALFSGYLGETALEHDAYWPTGDMGYIDEDGYLFLHGRKKNLIITAYGRNFSPEWAESELSAYPSIQQAVVFGDAQPFNVAIIFPAPGVNPAYLNQVVKQANERLPPYAHIKRFHVAEQPCSPRNGMMTMNGRPRREMIANFYQPHIEAMYEVYQHAVL